MTSILTNNDYASGTFNKETREWEWDPVEWKRQGSFYVSNRHIPGEYFNYDYWVPPGTRRKKRNVAGCIILRPPKHSQNAIHGLNDYEVLVVQCYNNKFGFPKGKCNDGETFIDAAMREFKEETGTDIKLSKNDKLYTITFKEYNKEIVFYVKIVPSDFEITSFPIADVEITAFGWVKLSEVHKLKLADLTKKLVRKLKSMSINHLNKNKELHVNKKQVLNTLLLNK